MTGFVARIDLDQPERALALAIEAWREHRAARIAELVDALDTAPAFAGDTKQWLAAARAAKTHVARGALIKAILDRSSADVGDAMRVAATWDDPRLTTQIIALLATVPWSGKRTRDVWRAVFEAAAGQRDARLVAIAGTLPATWNVGADTKKFLANRLAEATEGLVAPDLPAAVDADITALIGKLAKPAGVTEASLLDAVYDSPDDDAPRSVYADWLQSKGDPRGELIALQLRGDAPVSKEQRKAMLGPLAPVLGADVVFRRGFPVAGTVRFRHQRDAEQFGALRAWATVETLTWAPTGVRQDQREWARYIGPAMSNLRHAIGPHPRFVLEAKTAWRMEELDIGPRESSADALRALCASPMLPRLRRLGISGKSEPAWLHGLTRGPPELMVHAELDAHRPWLAAATPTPLPTLTLAYWIFHYTFVRDASGAFTRLDVVVRPREPIKSIDKLPVATQFADLAKLDGFAITTRAEIAGELVPIDVAALAKRRKAVR